MDLAAEGWHSAFRIELRVQVLELASRGWSVFPGTYPVVGGWDGHESTGALSGREDVVEGPLPIRRNWTGELVGADNVAAWWSERPYSVLLATGTDIEAIEVDADHGRRTARALRASGSPVPIAATPHGRWYFLTTGGQQLNGELADEGVVLHSEGSWIPLPPSTFPEGILHWRVKPQMCDWRLPDPDHVQEALLTGLHDLAERSGLASQPLAAM
ncbi:bifunctional DNA primase/polymerase [Actinopolyspora saharensis]|uniref:bifunctional DNA primase/polymerase n=1 Tax=Actinopolyspora saharensis TaxID=995062 RepID=UPI003F67D6EF